MKKLILILFIAQWSFAQKEYSVANAHSHNDYEQVRPFFEAYEAGFGSIEADVFLKNDTLFVAHESKNIRSEMTFENLYLKPVLEIFNRNNGLIYPDYGLQILVDLKTGYQTTLPVLEKLMESCKNYLYPKGPLKIVISGSVPPKEEFSNYAEFIYFDGRPDVEYSANELEKVALISQNAWLISLWNKEGLPTQPEKIANVINQIHKLAKPVRLWATPDKENTWKYLMESGVDFINTDRIVSLAEYLSK